MEEARTAIWKELTDISTILMSERELEDKKQSRK